MEKYFIDKDGFYKGKCGMCEHLSICNISKATPRGYVCDIHNQGFFGTIGVAFDDTCNKQRNAKGRNHKDIKEAYEKLVKKCGRYTPRSYNYYIMTAIRDILGNECDDYWIMIGYLRDNIMQNELKYFNLLVYYDMYGSQIAMALMNDENKEIVARELLEKYIKPVYSLIIEGDIERAINLYQEMVDELKDLYNIANIELPKKLNRAKVYSMC